MKARHNKLSDKEYGAIWLADQIIATLNKLEAQSRKESDVVISEDLKALDKRLNHRVK